MTEADQIRTRLDQYAATEQTNPSPVWAPITHPGPCRPPFLARTRDCDCSRCCAAAPHEPGCTRPDSPECTCPDDAAYHLPGCPEFEEDEMAAEPTAEEIRLCHKATEFDHQCRVCTSVDERPDDDRMNHMTNEDREPVYWFCNSCGEEVGGEFDQCCDDGEIEPSYDD